jgi:Ser/Thr protein kinase RdoA (MazF antagonist)
VLLEKSDEIDEHWRFVSQEATSLGIDRLPKQLVHGDVSPVNMVFEDRSSRFALIDWDCLHYGFPLYDALGDVLNRPPLGLTERFDFQIEEVRRYLKGYQDRIGHKISRHELRCVPVLCAAGQLVDLRQRVRVLASLSGEQDQEFAVLIRGRIRILNQIVGLKNQFPNEL